MNLNISIVRQPQDNLSPNVIYNILSYHNINKDEPKKATGQSGVDSSM
ncbi:MAG TPA: hypothetical protein VF222_00925 [Nitrososphaeraceae archaeon]